MPGRWGRCGVISSTSCSRRRDPAHLTLEQKLRFYDGVSSVAGENLSDMSFYRNTVWFVKGLQEYTK